MYRRTVKRCVRYEDSSNSWCGWTDRIYLIAELEESRRGQKEAELKRIERELGVSDRDFKFDVVYWRIGDIDNLEIDKRVDLIVKSD